MAAPPSKISLATLAGGVEVGSAPSIDAAREAMGGRVCTERGAGAAVIVAMKRGADARGVVVCVSGPSRDVWIGEGRFVRTTVDRLAALAEPGPELDAVADDARRFAALREGQPVQALRRDGTGLAGVLLEKCRYGALVGQGSVVIAVSFRKVIAAPS